jgi:hypothetical protein
MKGKVSDEEERSIVREGGRGQILVLLLLVVNNSI